MMLTSAQLFPLQQFDQIVVANFGLFQLAIPSRVNLTHQRIFSVQVPVPERVYGNQGWLIHNQAIVAWIRDLSIGSIFTEDSPFKTIQRIDTAIPLSFTAESAHPLPTLLQCEAALSYQWSNEPLPHQLFFQELSPRFVRASAFESSSCILEKAQQMQEAEARFIQENRERLRQVPFYQQRFGLGLS